MDIRVVFNAGCLFLLGGLLAGQTPKANQIHSHLERAQQDLQAQRLEEAKQELKAALQLDKNIPEAHANLGLIALVQASYNEAADEFRLALKVQPSLLNAKAFLGLTEMHTGKLSEAKQTLEESLAALKDVAVRIQVGTALVEIDYGLGRLDDALAATNMLQTIAPNDPDILYMTYRTHSAIASRALAKLARVDGDSARLHEVLGESHESESNFSAAISEFKKALAISPGLPGIHFELGQALLRNEANGNSPEAEHEFELALAENPNDAHSEYELGEISYARSDLKTALEDYSKALEMQPDLADAYIGLGGVLLDLGRVEEAIQRLRAAIRLDDENATAHYRLARAYKSLNQVDDAEREMKAFERLKKSQSTIMSSGNQ